MVNFRMFRLAAAALAVVGSLAGSSYADTITQGGTIASQGTDFSTNFTPLFNLFDTSLGTLNSVSITLTMSGSTSGSVTNNSGSVVNIKPTAEVDLTLGSSNAAIDALVSGLTGIIQGSVVLANVGIGATVPFGPIGLVGPAVAATYGAGDVAAFTGVGTYAVSGSTDSLIGFLVSGGGSASGTFETTAGATISIVYDYTPGGGPSIVPEPSTMLLSAMGLVGLLCVRSRRSRVAA